MHGHDPGSAPLTLAGQTRRDEMLVGLISHVRGRRRRRRAFRAGSALILVTVTGWWGVLRFTGTRSPGTPVPPSFRTPTAAASPTSMPTPSPQPKARTLFVQTDPGSAQRLRFTADRANTLQTIGDDQLIDALVEAGRPSGLVRIGARVTIVDPSETDAPSPSSPEAPGRVDSSRPPTIRGTHAAV